MRSILGLAKLTALTFQPTVQGGKTGGTGHIPSLGNEDEFRETGEIRTKKGLQKYEYAEYTPKHTVQAFS